MILDKIDGKIIKFPECRGSQSGLKYPALAEIKHDGELCYMRIDQVKPWTINKYGTMRSDFPELNLIAGEMKAAGTQSALLIGELYWNEGKLHESYALSSNKKSDKVKLSVFDIMELDGGNMRDMTLVERKETINERGLQSWAPKCWVVQDEAESDLIFQNVINDGYEGIVMKNLDSKYVCGPCDWVKRKFKDRNNLQIVSIDPVKEKIEVMHISPDTNGMSMRYVPVGVKAPNKYKKHLKIGDVVEIEHQGVLPSGSLRHTVLIPKPEWK